MSNKFNDLDGDLKDLSFETSKQSADETIVTEDQMDEINIVEEGLENVDFSEDGEVRRKKHNRKIIYKFLAICVLAIGSSYFAFYGTANSMQSVNKDYLVGVYENKPLDIQATFSEQSEGDAVALFSDYYKSESTVSFHADFSSRFSFEIREPYISEEGDSGQIITQVTVIDWASLSSSEILTSDEIASVFDGIDSVADLPTLLSDPDTKAVFDKLGDAAKDKTLPLLTADATFEFIKVDGGWEIVFTEQLLSETIGAIEDAK